jgi:hypothetical protein
MAITSYPTSMTAAIAGQLADGSANDIRSFVNDEASAEMPFGCAVVQGSSEKAALVPASDDQKVVGIVVHCHVYGADDLGDDGVKPECEINVLNRGRIWAEAATSASIGDRGYVHYAGDQAGRIGNLETIDVAFGTEKQIRFLTAAAAAGDLVVVEVDFNNEQDASSVTPSA